MSYQPADSLTNRTFVGLIVAQFLAGFNDQAIHAAAMFYAIHTKILSQDNAITLMPMLFYSPWAIFCTLSGYYADRYSKTMTLRIWKVAEIVISLIMIAGFYLGGNPGTVTIGAWLVMSCVFLMGTHAAFFAPAKYGAMPEILRPHILSRGNGILESTTFLASILGTVGGGLLFHQFRDNEVWIGVILLVLSIIGALASFLIHWLPASCPERLVPVNLFKPLFDNLKVMFRSRPLALAVLGIAFFVFMVSYMRASMYMHGETRNPRWDEEKTSLIVATVALGVGLGSPFAGYLSGGKVELGLVPLGCVGMILALVASAIYIEHTVVLVIALIVIGFFSGFYMVPLYTLLQQRAPKKSKGELVATSNFINVTGAIAASVLFKVLVVAGQFTGVTPPMQVKEEAGGTLTRVVFDKGGKLAKVNVKTADGNIVKFRAKGIKLDDDEPLEKQTIQFEENLFDMLSGTPTEGEEVVVSSYEQGKAQHYVIGRGPPGQPVRIFDTEKLPRYLFLGAALMTVGILFALRRKLPDFYVRTLFWYQSLGKYRLRAVGMQNLPTEGPVILACNCKDLIGCLQLVSATDRSTEVILVEDGSNLQDGVLLRRMALYFSIVAVQPGPNLQESWRHARHAAERTLKGGHLLAVGVDNDGQATELDAFLGELRAKTKAPIVPVYCGSLDDGAPGVKPRIRVVFGEMMMPGTPEPPAFREGEPLAVAFTASALAPPPAITVDDCKKAITRLGVWIRENDGVAGTDEHH